MQTIAKKVVQNWAAKGYISDDEVEMCLYNLMVGFISAGSAGRKSSISSSS